MLDQHLFLYLQSFRISAHDQMDALKVKCALCRRKNTCCTITFEHIQSGYTLVRSMCQLCSDKVRKMHAHLKYLENINA